MTDPSNESPKPLRTVDDQASTVKVVLVLAAIAAVLWFAFGRGDDVLERAVGHRDLFDRDGERPHHLREHVERRLLHRHLRRHRLTIETTGAPSGASVRRLP